MFAALTQSFLDAINAGAVPTIATSWQVKKNTHTHSQSMYVCMYLLSPLVTGCHFKVLNPKP
jgi:hypothetical protein